MSIAIKAIEIDEIENGKIVEVHVTGKLTSDDYHDFVPEVERLVERHGKVRILFDMHDFHGWTAGALWEDFKFDLKHFNHIERLAVVGETKWEKGMAAFCKPFTTAKIRYFDRSEIDAARDWINAE
ncbi:MAG: STAS/SEC14 domain-containing protein [Phycisphaera sp.]|nr:STAS/SEC14 domain-containing protein [Phycisphaera sp.]